MGEKVSRNLRWLGDSFEAEVKAGPVLGVKAKVGPLKAGISGGSATVGGGATFGDMYTFTEVSGPTGGVELGNYGFGYLGNTERFYIGRGSNIYSEEIVAGGGFTIGRKNVGASPYDGEIGLSAGLLVGEGSVSVNIGKVAVSLFYWGDSQVVP